MGFLYLTPARSNLFRALPELEWPKRFSVRRARSIVDRIEAVRRRTLSWLMTELRYARGNALGSLELGKTIP